MLEPADAERKAGSPGRALLGTQLRIDEGEILVRGPVIAPSARTDDGWLRTGDLGAIDAEGYLWVDGRLGDLIVTGGENVMPERVEDVLRAHPDVADAAVVGPTGPRVARSGHRSRHPASRRRRGSRLLAGSLRAGASGLRGAKALRLRHGPAKNSLRQADALGPPLKGTVPRKRTESVPDQPKGDSPL